MPCEAGAALDPEDDFWSVLEAMIASEGIVIDRPRGSTHPRYPSIRYQIDYGFIRNSSAMDGAEVDIWVGEGGERRVVGVICTLDTTKRDSETKILYACSEAEIATILRFYNESPSMRGVLIRR